MLANPADHLGIAGKPRIRQTKMRCHHAIAGHVQHIEAHAVRDLCRDHVEDAGCRDQPRLFHTLGQSFSGRDFIFIFASVSALANLRGTMFPERWMVQFGNANPATRRRVPLPKRLFGN